MGKQKIAKHEISTRVYILNCHIHALKQQASESNCEENALIRAKIKEPSNLKSQVLLKMVREGFARFRTIQMEGEKGIFYTVRVSRELSFHILVTNEAKRLMRSLYG